ncbi:MAG TPA: phosphoribosyltransferase, partial [bacterium]|nr:phosphoribosyltransferase [bacterium]
IAMGYTVQAALETVRAQKPGKVILALPVGPKEMIERLARRADETVCLNIPSWFEGVSQFYRDFSEVTDTEVLKILEDEKLRRAHSKAKNSQTA